MSHNEDDDVSIQILEPEVDQQYVRERRTKNDSRATNTISAAAASNVAKQQNTTNTSTVKQPPPLIIVEQKLVPTLPTKATTAPTQTNTKEEQPRIVNIVDESVRLEKTESKKWWEDKIQNIVWLIVQFLAMAVCAFFILVILNPPFVQEKSDNGVIALQKQPASLSKTAIWSSLAGLAFIIAPFVWKLATSRFFPSDLFGIPRAKK